MQTWNLGTKSWNLGILESLYAVKCPSRASSEEMSIAKKTRITQISCWCLAQDKWTRTLSLSEPKSIIVDWYVEPSGLASWMVCLFILPVDHYCAFGEVQQITKRQWNWILSKEIPNVSKQSLVKTAMSWIVYCPPRLYEFFCSSIQVEVSTLLLALVRFVFRIASSYPNNLHPRQRKHNIHRDNQISIFLSILLLLLLLLYQYHDYKKNTSSTAQGGGSFKDWKSIGEVSCRGVRSLTSKLLQFPIRKHLPIISRHKSRHLSPVLLPALLRQLLQKGAERRQLFRGRKCSLGSVHANRAEHDLFNSQTSGNTNHTMPYNNLAAFHFSQKKTGQNHPKSERWGLQAACDEEAKRLAAAAHSAKPIPAPASWPPETCVKKFSTGLWYLLPGICNAFASDLCGPSRYPEETLSDYGKGRATAWFYSFGSRFPTSTGFFFLFFHMQKT